jgi:hypothetical protein
MLRSFMMSSPPPAPLVPGLAAIYRTCATVCSGAADTAFTITSHAREIAGAAVRDTAEDRSDAGRGLSPPTRLATDLSILSVPHNQTFVLTRL